ncbi:hypothetical protein DUNSADRAFT_8123 [Dunaliella salina]|uniref:J domain-containing protein n=1 Tax=Dunaliella salina TaxID=3046 RepID=A0ABQ7GJY8_DUNSA|nr:hypothetical protein DUNSADRAFT_8123 [Dunaliella salina]|eukprot:KAF5834935.1 hypothetical protein DUNSADRAFT_8123 [Dunaliella salina]
MQAGYGSLQAASKLSRQYSITLGGKPSNQLAGHHVHYPAFKPANVHLSFRLYAARKETGSVKGESLYDVLRVSSAASLEQIKHAYRQIARKSHPDLFQPGPEQLEAEARLRKVNNAYEVLSDAAQRAEYDVRWKFAQEATSAYASTTRPGAEDPAKAAHFAAQMAAAQEALARAAQARTLARTARRQAEALRKRTRDVSVPQRQPSAQPKGRQQQHETSFPTNTRPPNGSSSRSSSNSSSKESNMHSGRTGSPDDHHGSNSGDAQITDSKEQRKRERQAARVARRQATEARARAQWAEFRAEGLQDRVWQALEQQQQQQQQQRQQRQQQEEQVAGHGLTHAEQRRQKREAARRAAAAAAAAARRGRAQGWQWPGRDVEEEEEIE